METQATLGLAPAWGDSNMLSLDDELICPSCGFRASIVYGFKVILDPPLARDDRLSRVRLHVEKEAQLNGLREGLPTVRCGSCDRRILVNPLAVLEG